MMSKNDLRLDPQNVRVGLDYKRVQENIWYYEEPNGLYVVVNIDAFSGLHKTRTFTIPRNQIERYISRLND